MTSRRHFLAAALCVPAISCATSRPRLSADPFSLGVASGYPGVNDVVIWTRLAPRPLEGGGMDPEPVAVRWELAEDESFRRIVRSGTASALPEDAHAVHVEVDGLAPARAYHYRFHCGDATSEPGRTRTAPEPGRGDERLRLAVASCQQYEQGWFVAHRHLAAEDVDLVAFVGDYIYESSWGRDRVRAHGTAEPGTLAEYRDRYALYKSDPDLRKAHASAPWVAIWDDHEVDNDYAGEQSEELHPRATFLARRAAAYKAFVEHLPLRRAARRATRIHGSLDWGRLARLHLLDTRQFKSPQPCPRPYRGGGNRLAGCDARLDPALSMLGPDQERWLDGELRQTRAAWNFVVQTTLFAPAPRSGPKGPEHWTDGWDGYPAARARLIGSITGHRASNPVFLGGDVHAAVHADVREGFAKDARVVAAELVATSITSQGPSPAASAALRAANPHIRHHDGSTRGYLVVDVGRGGLEARVRGVATVKQAEAPVATVASARIEAGRPGLA